MLKKSLFICIALGVSPSFAATAEVSSSGAKLSVAQIADKNVASRGGLQAWRLVRTMSMAGKLGAGGNQRGQVPAASPGRGGIQAVVPQRPAEEVQLPFVMELGRPRKSRLELQFNDQTAVQVFDGANGWKLRPFLNREVVEPYTADEMKTASMQADLDGPLVDYAAKGTKIELAGMEKVDDRDTYKLRLTMKNGEAIHVWIDAQTFLEAKIQGQPRRLDGIDHPVEVYMRDYRPVNGLQIPFVLETRVLPVARTAKGVRDTPVPAETTAIERVAVNPKLDEARFAKPEVQASSSAR
jgi:hypothetical protein